MNNKYFVWGGILVLLVAGIIAIAFFMPNADINTEEEPINGAESEVTREGVVVDIDSDQIAFDGPFLITIEGENGERSIIAIPSMGLPLCEAYKNNNIKDTNSIQIGNSVEVSGKLSADGSIVPCDSASHYLR